MNNEVNIPHQSLLQVFLRFLRFGLLAWGGPVAQIDMIREELVEQEGWISRERFNRVLAVYQVLPGPEAHELCVYFGMLARGRPGAFLAGLGFMLPGLLLMLALSWFYVTYGLKSELFKAVFFGFQAAAAALILRAIFRIGSHALLNQPLWLIAIGAFAATLLNINFIAILLFSGLAYALVKHRLPDKLGLPILLVPANVGLAALTPSTTELFGYGLRTGLLTFGGAYTAIPFLQQDAVVHGAWMTNQQFLDGLALGSILPAPLIIFSTFVGYLGGGLAGALAMTAGVFLPAFLFTMLGHQFFERLVENTDIHAFLDGITAGVVGLIAATTISLLASALQGWLAVTIFATALLILFRWKNKLAIPLVMIGAGLLGLLVTLS